MMIVRLSGHPLVQDSLRDHAGLVNYAQPNMSESSTCNLLEERAGAYACLYNVSI